MLKPDEWAGAVGAEGYEEVTNSCYYRVSPEREKRENSAKEKRESTVLQSLSGLVAHIHI